MPTAASSTRAPAVALWVVAMVVGLCAAGFSAEQIEDLGVGVAELPEPAVVELVQLGFSSGVVVETINPNGRAAKAGIDWRDVIVQLHTSRIDSPTQLADVARRTRSQTVDLVFVRSGAAYLEIVPPVGGEGAGPVEPPTVPPAELPPLPPATGASPLSGGLASSPFAPASPSLAVNPSPPPAGRPTSIAQGGGGAPAASPGGGGGGGGGVVPSNAKGGARSYWFLLLPLLLGIAGLLAAILFLEKRRTTAGARKERTARGTGLVVEITEPGRGPRRLPLDSLPAMIGRQTGCRIRLSDKEVSNEHARLAWAAGSVTVTDLESANGTFVDGRPVRHRRLGPESVLKVGRTTLRLLGAPQGPSASGEGG